MQQSTKVQIEVRCGKAPWIHNNVGQNSSQGHARDFTLLNYNLHARTHLDLNLDLKIESGSESWILNLNLDI